MNAQPVKTFAGNYRQDDAGGIKAISRLLRRAATTPPVCSANAERIPEGCQPVHLSVQKPIFIFHPQLLQKLLQPLAQRFHPMMLGLVPNEFCTLGRAVGLHAQTSRPAC